MTKREFDAANKVNFGTRMASDTCESYRDTMHRPMRYSRRDWDRLAVRAAYSTERKAWHGAKGALTMGSKLRAPLRWRMTGK